MTLKKIILPVILLASSLSLVSCGFSKEKGAEEFDLYLQGLPQEFIEADNLNLEFLFQNPQDYGFEETLLNLPYADETDYEETKQQSKTILEELEEFNYDDLNDEQQLTYDILKDNLERSLLTLDYYDLDNSYLGSFVSFQAQLPFLLSEYSFEKENDLNSYFHILETSEEVFHKYVEIEKQRQEKDTGMSKTILDKTIQQCDNFSQSDPLYLIDDINKKIDEIDFLSDEEKETAKAKNADYLVNHLQVAYKNTKDELSLIQADEQDLGLFHQPNGKEYYEALLKQSTGIDMNIEDVKTYLDRKLLELFNEANTLFAKNPNLINANFENLKYSDFTSVEETLLYLETKIPEDFPQLDELNFKISTVDESMKDNFSPAAYLQSRIDSPITTKEAIIINGKYEDSLFPTIMHEGYPGHMYQNVYFKTLKQPTVRYLLDYSGYSEGWATYIENYSSKYAPVDNHSLIEIYNLNSDIMKVYMCLFDIGIHYDGWDRTKFKSQMEEIFGQGTYDDEIINDQYDIFLETPANTLKYNLTYFKFQDLYQKAKSELKGNFESVNFHEVILKTGPAPFHILENQVEKFIEENKA